MFKRHRRKLFILITFIIIIHTLVLSGSPPTHTHTHKHLNGWHFSSMIASLSLKQKLTVGTKEEKPSSYCLFFSSLLLLLLLVLVENAQKLFHIDIFASLWVCSTAFINNHCWLRSTNKDYTSKSGSFACSLLSTCSFGEFCVDGWKIRPKALATFWICIALPWLRPMCRFIMRIWDVPKVHFECGNDRTTDRDGDRERMELKINLNVEFVIPCANEGTKESEREHTVIQLFW